MVDTVFETAPLDAAGSKDLVRFVFGEVHGPLPFNRTADHVANELMENAVESCKYVAKKATRGDVSSVLKAMDDFGYSKGFIISVGDVTGDFMDEQIELLKPKVVVELGAFVGYGALRFARKLKEVVGPSAHVYSFEVWEPFAVMSEKMIEFAGLSDMITVIHGSFAEKVDELKSFGVEKFDLVLIDHNPSVYLSDLHVLEHKELLKPGSVVLADNVVFQHCTEYCEYVRSNPMYKTYLKDLPMSYKPGFKDGMEVSTYLGSSAP